MHTLRFQCPPGRQNTKMASDTGCIRRLAMMAKNPEKYQLSKCLGCTGPVPSDSPQEVKVSPAPVPQVHPKPAALASRRAAPETAPSPAPETAAAPPETRQDETKATTLAQEESAPPEIVAPGANERVEHLPLHQRPCSKCKSNPRLPYSRLCRGCNREYQNAHARKRRAEVKAACQAQRLLESAELPAHSMPAKAEPPLALVRMLQERVKAARGCLSMAAEVGHDEQQAQTLCVHTSAAVLITMIEALAAAGGIPGWEEV